MVPGSPVSPPFVLFKLEIYGGVSALCLSFPYVPAVYVNNASTHHVNKASFLSLSSPIYAPFLSYQSPATQSFIYLRQNRFQTLYHLRTLLAPHHLVIPPAISSYTSHYHL